MSGFGWSGTNSHVVLEGYGVTDDGPAVASSGHWAAGAARPIPVAITESIAPPVAVTTPESIARPAAGVMKESVAQAPLGKETGPAARELTALTGCR